MTQATKTLIIFCFLWSVLPVTLSRGRTVPVPILLASRQNSYYIDDLIRQRINDVKTNKLNSYRITWLTNNSQITVMQSFLELTLPATNCTSLLDHGQRRHFSYWGWPGASRRRAPLSKADIARTQYEYNTLTQIIYNKTMIYRMLACRSMTHSIIWN